MPCVKQEMGSWGKDLFRIVNQDILTLSLHWHLRDPAPLLPRRTCHLIYISDTQAVRGKRCTSMAGIFQKINYALTSLRRRLCTAGAQG